MKLFMIRHGQSEYNLNSLYSGQADTILTEEGRRQAEALRPLLAEFPFDRVYSSDLTRAVHTQQLALPGVKAQATPLLREVNTGTLTGQPIGLVREHYGNLHGHFAQFGGEEPEDVTARLRRFLAELEACPCEYVAAFAHGGLIRYMLSYVLGHTVNAVTISSANCNIGIFEFDGQEWKLLAWNYGSKI